MFISWIKILDLFPGRQKELTSNIFIYYTAKDKLYSINELSYFFKSSIYEKLPMQF